MENGNSSEKNIFQYLAEERLKWNDKHSKLTKDMRDIYKLAEMQVDLYSTIQEALENYHYILSLCSKKNAQWRKIKVEEYKDLHFKSDINYKRDADKDLYIQDKHKQVYLVKEALDNHLTFLKDFLGDLRSMTYGVKYRIELEQFKRGGGDYEG